MTDWTPGQVAEGLRNTSTAPQSLAAVELLVEHGTWMEALTEPDDRRLDNSIVRFATMFPAHAGGGKRYVHLRRYSRRCSRPVFHTDRHLSKRRCARSSGTSPPKPKLN